MDWTDDDRRLENEQVALWETLITEAKLKPNQALFEDLWLGFRKMGHRRTWDGHNPKVDVVYEALQNEFLSRPGHAEYFLAKIETEWATLKPQDDRTSYERQRDWAFEALSHLPSPETIRVLGHYLSDDKDAAKKAVWTSDFLLMRIASCGHHAREALKKVGLRNTEFTEPTVGEWPSHANFNTREEHMRVLFDYLVAQREAQLKPWRAWFEEVKSGQRTFSFKGQPVEYRFRPDGTWETVAMVNPPDDGPRPTKPVIGAERPDKRPHSTVVENVTLPKGYWWWAWLLISVLALLAGVIWSQRKKSNNSA